MTFSSLAVFAATLSLFAFTQEVSGQQYRNSGQRYQNATRGQYRSQRSYPSPASFRVSTNPRQLAAQSVVTPGFSGDAAAPSWQPELGSFIVDGNGSGVAGSAMANSSFNNGSMFHPAGRSRAEWEMRFQDSTTKAWGDGYYPTVRGDIFGISSSECCDEWAAHCDCLELTSTISNCECDNPRRAHWARGNGLVDSRGGGCGCESCSRSNGSSQGSVSDYFHSNGR